MWEQCLACGRRIFARRYRVRGYCAACMLVRAVPWPRGHALAAPLPTRPTSIAYRVTRYVLATMKAPDGTKCAHCGNDDPRLLEDDHWHWFCSVCSRHTPKTPPPER